MSGEQNEDIEWGQVAAFLLKVRELREQQKLYFQTRSKDALMKSINLEKEVDSALQSDALLLDIMSNF